MRVLLTGIAGFAGSHLAEYLLREPQATADVLPPGEALEIHGVIHRHDRRIQHLRSALHLHRGDLRNALWVSELIQQVQPDRILHLAAWSDVGGSWAQPWTTYELNIHCQLNLLEAVRRWAPDCRTLIVTSNEVYGLVQPEDLPIDEETPFRPNSPYGVSKVAQDMMGLQYWNSHRIPTIRARSFNHIGPGQSDDFVASAFARQIAEIEAGLREPVVAVGNLEAQRDFTDVRDVVRAYWLVINRGEPGQVYNIGRGEARPVRWLLDTLLQLTPAQVSVTQDPTRLRPSDVPISVCDNRRLVAATGWQPRVTLQDSLRDLLDSWREQLRRDPTGGPAGRPTSISARDFEE
ncbi:GDP-mannose 4,6-dehydratase [Litorilinea aerophila]|uniref:GDP-mannose 4,6-dehydratase n=1 Tax=Litorilinea aerophila TaxID=1204385 RepID=A0A540VE07_9CHLR|nr:GDP-mannose 4,6-dehydratase [Litorilinea aerophila]MCC9077318.1 GDP-mannose 4,6-dehydratase [Litorilinea aerophila]